MRTGKKRSDDFLVFLYHQKEKIQQNLNELLNTWPRLQGQLSLVDTERQNPAPHILLSFNLDPRTVRHRGYAHGKKDFKGDLTWYPPFRNREMMKIHQVVVRLLPDTNLRFSYSQPQEYDRHAYLEYKITVASGLSIS